MLWNLLPFAYFSGPWALALNLLFWPIWLNTAWIEFYWNMYTVMNAQVEVLLTPYYIYCFI